MGVPEWSDKWSRRTDRGDTWIVKSGLIAIVTANHDAHKLDRQDLLEASWNQA
jgi:hypothetical protein